MNDKSKLVILNYLYHRIIERLAEKSIWVENLIEHVKEYEDALEKSGISWPREGTQNKASVNMDYLRAELESEIDTILEMGQILEGQDV